MMNHAAASITPPPYPSGQNRTPQGTSHPGAAPAQDELARIFNTALVATLAGGARDFSTEIFELMESPPFRAILGAVRQHARLQGLSERQAAEQIIASFRKIDQVWSDYVFQEGVDRIKNPST